jgi:hypothetical protein
MCKVCELDGMEHNYCSICNTKKKHVTYDNYGQEISIKDYVLCEIDGFTITGILSEIDFSQNKPFKIIFDNGEWKNVDKIIKIEIKKGTY